MRWTKAWTVASKDFKIFVRKNTILYTMLGFEVFVSLGLPLLIRFVIGKAGNTAVIVPGLINSLSFWFVMGVVLLPTGIASYSLVGEKVQKSLEPLLATPTTDEEILAGKATAAFVPALVANYVGAVIFMVLVNAFAYGALGYRFFPDLNITIELLLLAPLACLLSIGYNVLVSSRSTDIRAAQQTGALVILPFGTVYVLSEIGVVALSITNLLIMAGVVAILDVCVFFLVRATFRREAILTEWK